MGKNVVYILGFFLLVAAAASAKKAVVHVIDQSICDQCGKCVKGCKDKAISIVVVNGKKIHEIDPALCTQCGECIEKCPKEAIFAMDKKDFKDPYYESKKK